MKPQCAVSETNEAVERVNTVVIGGGPAGVCMAIRLQEQGTPHVILERGTIFDSWKSRRWDNFNFNTPLRHNMLTGMPLPPSLDPDSIPTGKDMVAMWEAYVSERNLDIRERSRVVNVVQEPVSPAIPDPDPNAAAAEVKDGEPADSVRLFRVSFESEDADGSLSIKHILARNVIAATGVHHVPRVPEASAKFPSQIQHFAPGSYTTPSELPEGATLVVGSGQTGIQIADELSRAGRRVYFATAATSAIPRSYCGVDMFDLFMHAKFFDFNKKDATPEMLVSKPPPFTGTQYGISYHSLHRQGVTLLGRFEEIDNAGKSLTFGPLKPNLEIADTSYSSNVEWLRSLYDAMVESGAVPCRTEYKVEESWIPSQELIDSAEKQGEQPQIIDIDEAGITSVVWGTGFKHDSYPWLSIEEVRSGLCKRSGRPQDLASPVPGFFWLGSDWLRIRGSCIVWGFPKDADVIAPQLFP